MKLTLKLSSKNVEDVISSSKCSETRFIIWEVAEMTFLNVLSTGSKDTPLYFWQLYLLCVTISFSHCQDGPRISGHCYGCSEKFLGKHFEGLSVPIHIKTTLFWFKYWRRDDVKWNTFQPCSWRQTSTDNRSWNIQVIL